MSQQLQKPKEGLLADELQDCQHQKKQILRTVLQYGIEHDVERVWDMLWKKELQRISEDFIRSMAPRCAERRDDPHQLSQEGQHNRLVLFDMLDSWWLSSWSENNDVTDHSDDPTPFQERISTLMRCIEKHDGSSKEVQQVVQEQIQEYNDGEYRYKGRLPPIVGEWAVEHYMKYNITK